MDPDFLKLCAPRHVMYQIFDNIRSKRDRRAMKCVCTWFNEAGKDHAMRGNITYQQLQVVDKALSITSDYFSTQRRFPAKCNITCGVGSGKTLIAMYIISRWVADGHRVIIALPPGRFMIWEEEWLKWQEKYSIPAMAIYHPSRNKSVNIPLTPVVMTSTGININFGHYNDSTPIATRQRKIIQHADEFTRGFTDESKITPYIFSYLKETNDDFLALNLDASRGIVSGIGSHAEDIDLPLLPETTVYIRNGYDINKILEAVRKSNAWRILICYNGIDYEMRDKLKTLYPFIGTEVPTKKREEMLREFVKEGNKRVLIAPVSYISKGHNIYPQEIYYITRNHSVALLYQLLGRAHRHGSPWSKVSVYVYVCYNTYRGEGKELLCILLECMARGSNDPVLAVKYFKKQFLKRPPPGKSNGQKSMNKWIQDNKESLKRDAWRFVLR